MILQTEWYDLQVVHKVFMMILLVMVAVLQVCQVAFNWAVQLHKCLLQVEVNSLLSRFVQLATIRFHNHLPTMYLFQELLYRQIEDKDIFPQVPLL